MSDVTRALKNWQDYKEIRVSGDSKPTANAKKLIALFTKATGQGTFEIARVVCSLVSDILMIQIALNFYCYFSIGWVDRSKTQS